MMQRHPYLNDKIVTPTNVSSLEYSSRIWKFEHTKNNNHTSKIKEKKRKKLGINKEEIS